MDEFISTPLDSLTGLRVLSNAAIITVHSVVFFALIVGLPDWYTVLENQWFARAALSTPLLIALNVFFALTALLASVHLIPRLQACRTHQQSRQVVYTYWWRRYMRIAPTFYAMLLIHASLWMWETSELSNNNPEADELALGIYSDRSHLKWLPAHFLFLGNLTGYVSLKLVPWIWTLMVQAGFYLMFPLLLILLRPKAPGLRGRLLITCIIMYLAAVAQRVIIILTMDLHTPMSLLAFSNRGKSAGHSAEAVRCYNDFILYIWDSAIGRLADLSSGLLVYLWISRPHARQQAKKSSMGYQAAAGVAVLFLLATVSFPIVPQAVEPEPHTPLPMLLVSLVAPLLVVSPPVVVAIMLYVILQPDAVSRLFAAMLSVKAWKPFSDRSYSIYLLHFDVAVLLFKAVPWVQLLGGVHSPWPVIILPFLLYFSTFLAAQGLDAAMFIAMRKLLQEHSVGGRKQKGW